MKKYEAAIENGELPVARGLRRSADDLERSWIINELMCNLYVDLSKVGEQNYARELEALKPLASMGLCEIRGHEIELTPLGGVFVRNVAMPFDAYLAHSKAQFSRTV